MPPPALSSPFLNGEMNRVSSLVFFFVNLNILNLQFFLKKNLGFLAKTASMHTRLMAGGHRTCFETSASCANLGSGHILPPLRGGVYGERWGWAAAGVTAGPT